MESAHSSQGDNFEVIIEGDRTEGSIKISIAGEMPGQCSPASVKLTNPKDKNEYPDRIENLKVVWGIKGPADSLRESSFFVDIPSTRFTLFVRAVENPDGSLSIRKAT